MTSQAVDPLRPSTDHMDLPPGITRSLRKNSLYRATHPDEVAEASDARSSQPHHPAPVLDTATPSMRRAVKELLHPSSMRSHRSYVDPVTVPDEKPAVVEADSFLSDVEGEPGEGDSLLRKDKKQAAPAMGFFSNLLQQTSAVAVICLLNIMMGIPFGASYFPIGWREAGADVVAGEGDGDAGGVFPMPGKQTLGIRMFLFATLVGQLVMTFSSKFSNAVALQMVENVPFLHALCYTVFKVQGHGQEALSTIFFLFGFSSVIVGITFYLLGKFEMGRIVYFFPNHVLVGCIGGIGAFITVTAIEVTNDVTFTFDMDGLEGLVEKFHLLWVVLAFEIVLRLLQWLTQDSEGRAKYPLLLPLYYCMITPIFFICLWIRGITLEEATDMGYFFPPIASADSGDHSIWTDPHLFDIFKIIDFSTISWMAVIQATGTMIALAAFSLIHVPINIPAFAISSNVDADMNAELVAHGYSNALAGIFGGLQNYMTYSNSVVYAKSGGDGRLSSLAITAFTGVLFVIGPTIATYLPRCMAGTLLLHAGLDLFVEGVYDSIGNFDQLEYFGIWAITVVMTLFGMTAALIAGVISALTTYAVQSINYQNPIRQILTASTLRSSAWTRDKESIAILESEKKGRGRVLIFELQGHLFFGNVAQLTDTIKAVLKEKKEVHESPIIVIVDFTLVVGMDSSAAHAVAKLKNIIHRVFHVELSIFVTGSGRGGFPCEFALSEALTEEAAKQVQRANVEDAGSNSTGTVSVSRGSLSERASKSLTRPEDGRVYESLDDALKYAEDILIVRENPTLLLTTPFNELQEVDAVNMDLQQERHYARKFLKELLYAESDRFEQNIDIILGMMTREDYVDEDDLWHSGDAGDSMKLLVAGTLISVIEETGAVEHVATGNIVGELGLVRGMKRLTTLVCSSRKAVLYSLSKETWLKMKREQPHVASLIDGLVIRYLTHRVQHVNNRYFHTTLPC